MILFPAKSVASRRASFIDLATWGTFTRSGEASYMVGAPTTGSTQFMQWAASHVRRFEDRGDGNGAMLLLEGSSANILFYSSDFNTANWINSGVTNDYGKAPDGTTTADRTNVSSGFLGSYQFYIAATSITTHSSWVRATSSSGTVPVRRGVVGAGLAIVAGRFVEATVDSTWTRIAVTYSEASTDSTYAAVNDRRSYTSVGGSGASASDAMWNLQQVERKAFATSAIVTTNSSATRGGDILTSTVAGSPSYMINGRWTFDVAPIFSSAEGIAHASDQCLFSFAEDDSERVFFVVSGGSIYLRVVSGGATKVTSNALTFSAHQKLTVIIDGSAGSISVSGATSGNGTVTGTGWTRTTGATIYVGNRQGATQPAFVRLGRYISAS